MMSLIKRYHFILLVLLIVLLFQIEYVNARPNATNSLYGVEIKTSESIHTLEASLDSSSSKQHDSAPTHDNAAVNNHADHGNEGHEGHEGHAVERYPVTTVDFVRVETPFIIGIWILFASIAKIGM